MKAFQFDGFGREILHMVEQDIPEPNSNQVLIRVGEVSLNFRDKLLVNAAYNFNLNFPISGGRKAS